MYTSVQLYSLMMWIPDCSQSRAQKNFFSLKGFSEVGTGVMRGSSQECASQYAIRSAAAFDTCRLGMVCLRLDCTLHFAFKDYRNLHSMGNDTLKTLISVFNNCVMWEENNTILHSFTFQCTFQLRCQLFPYLICTLVDCSK